MSRKRIIIISSLLIVLIVISSFLIFYKTNPNPEYTIGQKLDSLNGVYVYYNGGIGNVEERNISPDGYNIGLRYQCIEFVKRYYYEHYHHKMPDSYGNAKDFFDKNTRDGKINIKRDLLQFNNPGSSFPAIGDLIVMDGHSGNPYGHVAIVSQVYDDNVEIIQQNPGPFASSRVLFHYELRDGKWYINNGRILGWLRKNKAID